MTTSTTSTQEGFKMTKTEITNLLSDVKNVQYYWEIGEYSEGAAQDLMQIINKKLDALEQQIQVLVDLEKL